MLLLLLRLLVSERIVGVVGLDSRIETRQVGVDSTLLVVVVDM